MNNKSAGQDKTIWEKIIKQKMVTVQGSKSTYKLNDKKNSSVEIHYSATRSKVPDTQSNFSHKSLCAAVKRQCESG